MMMLDSGMERCDCDDHGWSIMVLMIMVVAQVMAIDDVVLLTEAFFLELISMECKSRKGKYC